MLFSMPRESAEHFFSNKVSRNHIFKRKAPKHCFSYPFKSQINELRGHASLKDTQVHFGWMLVWLFASVCKHKILFFKQNCLCLYSGSLRRQACQQVPSSCPWPVQFGKQSSAILIGKMVRKHPALHWSRMHEGCSTACWTFSADARLSWLKGSTSSSTLASSPTPTA